MDHDLMVWWGESTFRLSFLPTFLIFFSRLVLVSSSNLISRLERFCLRRVSVLYRWVSLEMLFLLCARLADGGLQKIGCGSCTCLFSFS